MAKPKAPSIGLSALFHPMNAESFITSHWPKQPHVVHDLGSSVKALTELPFLQSLDAMLKSWPYPIQAHLPDVRDEASAIDANATDARKLFDNRMGLLFNNVQRISPILEQWLKTIREELGLPQMTYGRCMV